jgi:hypothetical protein
MLMQELLGGFRARINVEKDGDRNRHDQHYTYYKYEFLGNMRSGV